MKTCAGMAARLALPFLVVAPVPAMADEPVTVLPDMVVQSRRFEELRNRIAPSLGASVYEVGREAIERLPQGENAALSDVLLQTPGVVQAPQGELHVRGDHRNLQYRVNGVLLPESISGFSRLFDVRAIESVSLITGALPAQFGYRTAGIVDLRLRSGAQNPGGSIGLYGGSFGTLQPSINYGQAVGPAEFYITGGYLQSQRGFENPSGSRDALHNDTQQLRGLANLSYNLTERTRLAAIFGTTQQRFRIPNLPGAVSGFPFDGLTSVDGTTLRARQSQRSSFGVVAVQHAFETADAQLSVFTRQAEVIYRPDPLGDLLGQGVASRSSRTNWSTGAQGDIAWRVAERHTIRAGFFASQDWTRTNAQNSVLALADVEAGNIFARPIALFDRSVVQGGLAGAYLQDEWRLTDELTLNFGARFDVASYQRTETQLSPRVNLVWQASPRTTLALGYARYFTPPPAELLGVPDIARYAGTTLQPEVLQASPIRAERSHYFNFGLRHRLGERLALGGELFFRESRNMQDLGQFGAAYIFLPYNYRRGQVYGAELSAIWRDGPLTAYANLTISRSLGTGIVSNEFFFSRAELDFINRRWVNTDHDQRFSGSAGVAWRPWEGGNLGATVIAGSGLRRGFANTQTVAPYGTANLTFSQRFELPRAGTWTARLDVLNLFDTRYVLRDSSGIGVGAAQFGMRRAVFAGLSRAF